MSCVPAARTPCSPSRKRNNRAATIGRDACLCLFAMRLPLPSADRAFSNPFSRDRVSDQNYNPEFDPILCCGRTAHHPAQYNPPFLPQRVSAHLPARKLDSPIGWCKRLNRQEGSLVHNPRPHRANLVVVDDVNLRQRWDLCFVVNHRCELDLADASEASLFIVAVTVLIPPSLPSSSLFLHFPPSPPSVPSSYDPFRFLTSQSPCFSLWHALLLNLRHLQISSSSFLGEAGCCISARITSVVKNAGAPHDKPIPPESHVGGLRDPRSSSNDQQHLKR